MKSFFCLTLFVGMSSVGIASANNNSAPSNYFGGHTKNNDDYMQWYETTGKALYNASTFLMFEEDTSQGAAIHWSIHPDNQSIALAVAVRASGWQGFGLSENGGMRGSDVFLFETAHSDRIRDAHVLDERFPISDECHQDWELQAWYPGANAASDFLIVQVTRALDTGDAQDRPILLVKDAPPTRVIAAWGDTPEAQYHGPNRVRGAVQWLQQPEVNEDLATRMKDASTFRVAANNYTIPVQETDYADFCLDATAMALQGVEIDQPISIIGIEPLIDQASHVHHLTVYGFPDASCDSMERSLLYVWGPGEAPLIFPDNVALYAGSNHSTTSFLLEIHYDNVNLDPNVHDNTTVQFYYTTKMRPIQADILQLGDPWVELAGTPVGSGDHTFSCPSSCSSTVLTEPVTIWREYLHMHAHGAQAVNDVIRHGEVVHRAQIDFFDYNQQGNPVVQQTSYQIQPGDAFRTTCRYVVSGTSDEQVRFGLSSQEEMCIAFLLYYPRQTFTGLPWMCGYDIPLDVCAATWDHSSNNTFPRVFGTMNSTECSSVPSFLLEENVVEHHDPMSSMHSSSGAGSVQGQRIGFSAILMMYMMTMLTSLV